MLSNHMKKKYRYASMKDAGYKKEKQTKEQLMKALKDIMNREADPQTATGPSYNFLDKIVKKGNEDWLEP